MKKNREIVAGRNSTGELSNDKRLDFETYRWDESAAKDDFEKWIQNIRQPKRPLNSQTNTLSDLNKIHSMACKNAEILHPNLTLPGEVGLKSFGESNVLNLLNN